MFATMRIYLSDMRVVEYLKVDLKVRFFYCKFWITAEQNINERRDSNRGIPTTLTVDETIMILPQLPTQPTLPVE